MQENKSGCFFSEHSIISVRNWNGHANNRVKTDVPHIDGCAKLCEFLAMLA